jgi:RNA polymerase sigma factor (TIGR02999 family)
MLQSGTTPQFDAAFLAAYGELRRLAAHMQRHDPAATLDPTGLVNAAWLKLAGSPDLADTSPLHFRRIAARAMRQVLVEAARRRHAGKRGGPQAMSITLDEQLRDGHGQAEEVLALHEALDALARLHPRPAAVVEARFFGGLSTLEVAELLEVSEATVLRDWRTARAWLATALEAS